MLRTGAEVIRRSRGDDRLAASSAYSDFPLSWLHYFLYLRLPLIRIRLTWILLKVNLATLQFFSS